MKTSWKVSMLLPIFAIALAACDAFTQSEIGPLSASGVVEAVEGIRSLWERLHESGEIARRRLMQVKREVAFRTEAHLRLQSVEKLGGSEACEKALQEWAVKIVSGESTPAEAAAKLARI